MNGFHFKNIRNLSPLIVFYLCCQDGQYIKSKKEKARIYGSALTHSHGRGYAREILALFDFELLKTSPVTERNFYIVFPSCLRETLNTCASFLNYLKEIKSHVLAKSLTVEYNRCAQTRGACKFCKPSHSDRCFWANSHKRKQDFSLRASVNRRTVITWLMIKFKYKYNG